VTVMSMPPSLESEDYEMLQTLINHFALQVQVERQRAHDLRRQLDCAKERIALLESAAYGVSFI
jgi:hypothetical protein